MSEPVVKRRFASQRERLNHVREQAAKRPQAEEKPPVKPPVKLPVKPIPPPPAIRPPPPPATRVGTDILSQAERERYMGTEQRSTFSAARKRKRTTDRRFNADWSIDDDTTNDADPRYAERIEPSFYGRARVAGVDDKDLSAAKRFGQSLIDRYGEAGKARANELLAAEKERLKSTERLTLHARHWSSKPLEDMKPRDWRLALSQYNIAVKGGNMPNPARSWSETGLPHNLLSTVERIGYKEPSSIQRIAIPISLQGRDVIGIAETGSGKTAAFALPLLVYISSLPPIDVRNPGPYALILAPTRELAQQIETETTKLASGTGFRVVSITGGHSIEEQVHNLQDGAEIIVATPGRLVDVIERRLLVLNSCCYIIMDEADRMIDMGFKEPLEKILDALPVTNEKPDTDAAEDALVMNSSIADAYTRNVTRYRQTHLYSATLSNAIQRLARQFTRRPAEIQIGEANTGVETVTQHLEFIAGEDRRKRRLEELLSQRDKYPHPVIVFVNVKRSCDALAKDIRHMGYNTATLHGSKTQEQREASLAALRRGEVGVLVATDLASRGIDVPGVGLVINFQLPKTIEPYLHRIGRTGRAGKTGTAISFISNDDTDIMYELKGVLQRSDISKVPEELKKHPAAQQKNNRGQPVHKNIE